MARRRRVPKRSVGMSRVRRRTTNSPVFCEAKNAPKKENVEGKNYDRRKQIVANRKKQLSCK